jgi:hypothetical protein
MGAASPIVAKSGSRPIAPVASPMIVIVMIRVRLRPMRSPRLPKMIAPMGRTMNATAMTANEPRSAAAGSSSGKKRAGAKIALK